MANKWGKDLQFKMDGAAHTIVTLTSYVNNASLRTAFTLFETHGMGVENPTRMHGMADARIPLNGWVNTTTEAILGPLQGTRTSRTKTAGFYNGIKWYTGEFLPEDIEFSSPGPNQQQTWSCNLAVSGAISRTSVAPS